MMHGWNVFPSKKTTDATLKLLGLLIALAAIGVGSIISVICYGIYSIFLK